MRWGVSLFRGPGRAAALAVVAVAVLLRALDFGLVTDLRLRVFDLEQRLWPRSSDPARVAIIDVDDKSLAQYGQWPWPRTRVAELVRRIAEGHPRVLGMDIIFAEPDRLSPPEIARELLDLPPKVAADLAELPSSDHQLAEAMRAVPIVLALAPSHEEGAPISGRIHAAMIRGAAGVDPTPFLKQYKSLVHPLQELADTAQGAGAIAFEPDDDGTVRRVALAEMYNGIIFPSFALEVLSVGGAAKGSTLIETGADGIKDIRVGDVTVPTDRQGQAIPHFAPRLARYISASEVLDPAFNSAELKNMVVLLGVTGLGITDLRQTPRGPVQGVDIQAQLIESMLLGTLLRRPPSLNWIEFAAALATGVVVIWLLPYDRPPRAAGIAFAIVAGLIGLELALFLFASLLFDSTFPAATLLAALGVMLVGNLRVAKAELLRYEGELAAARAIQLGLLPQPFPASGDIDIYARIEPAETIGGDLYDYLLIDRGRRLFFLIADVSGDGIPAAVFMAATKVAVRDAVQTSGTELDRILAEANRKTVGASPELPSGSGGGMFVTAFAGILELSTGEITYASAGHDSPFVLGNDKQLRRLVTEGGPPLGAIDGFSYPVDLARIEPGEVLLLYTDGVTEAENVDRTLYSSERLAKVLTKAPDVDAERLVAAVIDDLRRFVGRAKQADDITLLAVRRMAGAAG